MKCLCFNLHMHSGCKLTFQFKDNPGFTIHHVVFCCTLDIFLLPIISWHFKKCFRTWSPDCQSELAHKFDKCRSLKISRKTSQGLNFWSSKWQAVWCLVTETLHWHLFILWLSDLKGNLGLLICKTTIRQRVLSTTALFRIICQI